VTGVQTCALPICLLVRSVCMVFDAYLEHQNRQRFSRVI